MNEYGLDADYFAAKLKRILQGVSRYTPSEMARELARMSVTADKSVLGEDEFLSVAVNAKLPEIGNLLNTQDNRCTADPFFVVFSKSEIVVDEAYDYDRIVWVTEDGDEVEDRKAKRLEVLERNGRDVGEYRRVAIKYIDQFETACFTEQGCKDFLKIQGHNLRRPFIYAHSFWRNHEMLAIREMLLKSSKKTEAD
jgi:hypothetical protein